MNDGIVAFEEYIESKIVSISHINIVKNEKEPFGPYLDNLS